MLTSLKQRVAARDESGFTLIELLVVLIIIGAAASDVRSAMPTAEAYFSDNDTYVGLNGLADLQAIDKGTSTDIQQVKGAAASYCITAKVGSQWAHVVGPGGTVVNDKTTAFTCP